MQASSIDTVVTSQGSPLGSGRRRRTVGREKREESNESPRRLRGVRYTRAATEVYMQQTGQTPPVHRERTETWQGSPVPRQRTEVHGP